MYLSKKSNILKHVLIPKHTVLSQKEKEKLLKSYNISEFQLPSIRTSDPVVKEIGGKPGDIIKIERDGATGKYNYYRRVVE